MTPPNNVLNSGFECSALVVAVMGDNEKLTQCCEPMPNGAAHPVGGIGESFSLIVT